MWLIWTVLVIMILIIILFYATSKGSKGEETHGKKEYAMPPQRRYPMYYYKGCVFFVDGSSRFAYSDEETEQLIFSIEESFKKADYSKTIKLANEVIKIAPKTDRAWIKKISAIFAEVISNEDPWTLALSKSVLNCCYGFLQCYENVLEKSIATKHTLLPVLLKNVEELIRYQANTVTKYHNFEVYNMLLNMYHIIPFKEILALLSNRILEDKIDKELSENTYAKQTLKTLLNQTDMLRTRNTSKLHEAFDGKKITNCTLITDERIEANIVAFELTFEKGVKKEVIEARFFDSDGSEIYFGKDSEARFIDTFETTSEIGGTSKQEIVMLTDTPISKVKLKIKDEDIKNNENKKEVSKNSEKNSKSEDTSKDGNVDSKADQIKNTDEISETEGYESKTKHQTLMYPSFENIKDMKISDTKFVALKEDGTIIALGLSNDIEQISTWENIEKVYLKKGTVFGVKKEGNVIFSGDSEYENIENIYSWENVESLSFGEKHILGLTKNNILYSVGSNLNGECEVAEWYDIIQVEAYYHTVGLQKDGTVKAAGENNFGECDVKAWQDIVQIAVGEFYTLGLTSSGKVLATGLNSCGQCNVSDWANIKKIYSSGNMSIGLRYDGKIVTAGKNLYRYDDAKNWARIKELVISNNRIVGIEQDGTVKATGKPYKNFVEGDIIDAKSVVINNSNIIALKEDNTVVSNLPLFGCFISNNFDGIRKISEDTETNRIAILNDKNVLCVSDKVENVVSTVVFPVMYDVMNFDISSTHLIVLKNDGKATYMNLSDGTVVEIKEWENLIDVKAGNNFIAGLDISGNVKVMSGSEGKKIDVSEWKDIVKLEAKGKRLAGLTIDGKLLMSGVSEFTEGDFVGILKNLKDFALTELQTMVIEGDGSVKVTYHPEGIGVESIALWKNIKKVVARGNNFIGLTHDGKIYSTIENEKEITKWEDIEDVGASDSYVWATLKMFDEKVMETT